jgi:uncharacterized membrane protein
MDKRILFVIIYIIVDIMYVYISKNRYDKTVINIQNASMPNRYIIALNAWICMAIGWYFLTTALLDKFIRNGMSPISAGALSGFITGLTIYGTFNFTIRAMFINYDIPLLIRDMIWGTSWLSIITIIYSISIYKL